MVLRSITLGICFLMLTACVSLNSVSLTPIPQERTGVVRTEKSKFIFLGFNFDNDFVDEAVEDLRRQCPDGQVTGLLTKDENINYFLYFFWRKQVTAKGYCVHNATASAGKKVNRGKASTDDPASMPSESGL